MELKLAKDSFKSDSPQESITLEKMAEVVNNNEKRGAIFYLDRENPEKNLKKLESFFKSKNRSTIVRELKISMDEKDYIYEVHIL
ncbi:HP0268 family nuclease [Helicobacter sp. MIT 14-3879]|uniref:HP0268 family nuclease n=1 Tax=Helicobacter sp. MIT 14-3879 TaxID=2040649 RepID=UPI000E1EEC4A|nr:HP0268 family nuclease [Helicobacter sp. MIT 14-3879]RDU60909.1 hypothetical protein CQA44_09930 [Helicobacter sp. MIT 14-3879]